MKYSQIIGIAASLALIAVCYQPWSYIESRNIIVTGLHATGTNFGRPGLINLILNVAITLLFILPYVWAKRLNVLIAALNVAWSIRNFLLLSACSGGECPQKRAGLYLLVSLSVIVQLITFFPRINIKETT